MTILIIDFRELSKDNLPGEQLEGLVRLLGQRSGFRPEWSGRGADRGRDLIFVDSESGSLSTTERRWLIQCKDNAQSGTSVNAIDLGSFFQTTRNHNCTGFMIVTTTTLSTNAKAALDAEQIRGEIKTYVWDRVELEHQLLKSENKDLLNQFFPESYKRLLAPKRSQKALFEQLKNQLKTEFGSMATERQTSSGISRWSVAEENIPFYSAELEFPQFIELISPGLGEINTITLCVYDK